MNATQIETAGRERPTLRDKSMDYAVRYLFGNRFEVSGNGRRYYPECVYIGGDFIARCTCPDKIFNHAATCKHELAVVRFERSRVASMQFN